MVVFQEHPNASLSRFRNIQTHSLSRSNSVSFLVTRGEEGEGGAHVLSWGCQALEKVCVVSSPSTF